MHHRERGDADRLAGVVLSQGGIAALQKHGLSEAELGIATLRDVAERVLGSLVLELPRADWHSMTAQAMSKLDTGVNLLTACRR